MNCVSLVLVTL